ncbi:RNA polymerase sigma factor [Chryseosolibacter indicus]|uniref:Sigma-70 family RNA polymerase sigma factor n=1 Tax=Chryseosolibacter indicus TaxID=2782351 RepID=A0ABS5VP08_9BACT|nr:sigma-70 family RNA polymerase sigma factor [Chryseosolibacter indicus]MBT1702514.1 sigma-70 family RNA polymerase sigma factor [Chryseosolibacter indicus]
MDSEYVVIDRILEGEAALYTELVDRYKGYVFTIAYKILQHKPEAEEAAQDAFIKAYHGLKGFNKESKFSTWLYRIAFNTAVSYKRKQKHQFYSIENSIITHQQEADGILEKTDKKKYLQHAISRLSETDQLAISLFYLEELSLEEISSITGTEANTLKVKIHRARIKIADELKKILDKEALTL